MAVSMEQKQVYFRAHGKMVLPRSAAEPDPDGKRYAATIAANFLSQGFEITQADAEKLEKCSKKDLVEFYQQGMKMLQERMGSNKQYHPFYPNFPEEVMGKSDADIFIDQFLYALSGFEIRPEVYEETKARLPFSDFNPINHPLPLVTEREYYRDVQNVMRSAESFTFPQTMEIDTLFANDKENAINLLPEDSDIKQKENKALLSSIGLEHNTQAVVRKYTKDAPDVLRLAAVLSAKRDFRKQNPEEEHGAEAEIRKMQMAASFKEYPSYKLSRKDRTMCAKLLERISKGSPEKLAVDMYAHKSAWKKFFNTIHREDLQNIHADNLIGAMDLVRSNASIDRYAKRIETAVQEKNVETALEEAKTHPGDFIRRFDKLLSMAVEQGKEDLALDALKDVSAKSGINPIFSLVNHIEARTRHGIPRVFSGEGRQIVTKPDVREPIPKEVAEKVRETCIGGLAQHFTGKGEMGRIYISPEMKNYQAPVSMRTLNEGVDVHTLGTVHPLRENKPTIRLFTGWTNECTGGNSRIDIDLTCDLLAKDGTLSHVGWNGAYALEGQEGNPCVYSGDVQTGDPGHGAKDCGAEYIDLNKEALKNAGVQYCMTTISLYCGADDFSEMKFLKAGFMERDERDEGELFEVKSVTSAEDVRNPSTMVLTTVYDVNHDQMIYVNKDLSRDYRVASNLEEELKKMLPMVIVQTNAGLTEDDIIRINAAGNNGVIVDDPSEADIVFMTAGEKKEYLEDNGAHSLDDMEVRMPDDFPYFTGVLMAEPAKDGHDLFHDSPEAAEKENDEKDVQAHDEMDDLDPLSSENGKPSRSVQDILDSLNNNAEKEGMSPVGGERSPRRGDRGKAGRVREDEWDR